MVGHRDGLAWWNFAFLATITVMPFTSSPLGEYPRNPLAVDIFAANLPLAVLATRAMSCWDAGGACLPGPSTPGRMGTARTGGGDHTGYRRVDRPGMGEHHSRQVLLGADPRRAVGRGVQGPHVRPRGGTPGQ